MTYFDRLDNSFAVTANHVAFAAALFIALSLLYFVKQFPYPSASFTPMQSISLILGSVVTLIAVLHPSLITNANRQYDYNQFIYAWLPFNIFVIYFISVMAVSLIILWGKYRHSEGVHRVVLRGVLVTIVVGSIFGSTFDLFLHYWSIHEFTWIGPIFTVFINYVVANLIFSRKEAA